LTTFLPRSDIARHSAREGFCSVRPSARHLPHPWKPSVGTGSFGESSREFVAVVTSNLHFRKRKNVINKSDIGRHGDSAACDVRVNDEKSVALTGVGVRGVFRTPDIDRRPTVHSTMDTGTGKRLGPCSVRAYQCPGPDYTAYNVTCSISIGRSKR